VGSSPSPITGSTAVISTNDSADIEMAFSDFTTTGHPDVIITGPLTDIAGARWAVALLGCSIETSRGCLTIMEIGNVEEMAIGATPNIVTGRSDVTEIDRLAAKVTGCLADILMDDPAGIVRGGSVDAEISQPG